MSPTNCSVLLDFTYQGEEISFQRPWKRLTVKEAILEYGDIDARSLADRDLAYAYAEKIGLDLPEDIGYGKLIIEIFEEVAEDQTDTADFHHRLSHGGFALSRKNDQDPEVVDRFEFLLRWAGDWPTHFPS